jgi:mannitol/fructose-specific phosphotransferase system IIA component (Ntr-type)
MAIALDDLLDAKHVDLNLGARAPETAFRKLIRLLTANEQVSDPQKFLEQVLARERANPSQIEHRVAFPHARTDLVEKIVLAIGRSRAGIRFGGKGERARLIFLIGVPQRLVNDYLVSVGALARIVKDDATRAGLLRAETAEEFLELLKGSH